MADKPEFVDLISEATTQSRRRSQSRMVDLVPAPTKGASRLAHRANPVEQWRLETLTPWKVKPWYKDWGWGS